MSRLLVLAIGGHALGSPGDQSYASERARIETLGPVFQRLVARGYRLLLVHGNGPQVGYLMHRVGSADELDIHVAQTQGELGYLLAQALPQPNLCVMTRVQVADDPGEPIKPIGPYLPVKPDHLPCREFSEGWRVMVPSPKPETILELDLVRSLAESVHLVAGGGGGIPLGRNGRPIPAVIDKDWVAARFATAFGAEALVFLTNVDHVYTGYGPDYDQAHGEPLIDLSVTACEALLKSGELGAGSMQPKVGAAAEFVAHSGQTAHIGVLEALEDMLAGRAGTRIAPD